ncbi:retinol dehydrogenase 14b [Silurus meridionalis]|uniref:retinol dehydrogenase 14b n=1 Tax=Silurus meridionalis TaxID=175797 RepID=UPI001EEBEAEE|nr:retinol dehydrogenase 14b [Silurus meridionalis]
MEGGTSVLRVRVAEVEYAWHCGYCSLMRCWCGVMAAAVMLALVLGAGGVLLMARRMRSRSQVAVRLYAGSMRGKTVIVTGASSGVGKATAAALFRMHARVIMACRDRARAERAAAEIRACAEDGEGELVIKHVDLTSLRSVRAFCLEIIQEELKLDVLINNAGVFRCPYTKTEDGFEMQFCVNHLSHFLLTHLLTELMVRSAPSRILVVSSKLYKYGSIRFDDVNSENEYDPAFCYSQSKLANLLFVRELARRLEGQGVTVNSLSPGMVRTNLGRHVHVPLLLKPLFFLVSWLFFKSPDEGAETPVFLASSPDVANVTGKFFSNCHEEVLLPSALDDGTAKRLWDLSETMVGMKS